MAKYIVYLHRNKANGKMYIGMTGRPLHFRSGKEGNGYRQNSRFYAEIQEYGWDGFTHTVLRTFTTRAEADECERRCISVYETDKPEHGYNIASGGYIGNSILGGNATGEKLRKPVCQYDLKGNLIAEYPGANVAARAIGKVKRSSSLVCVCNGKRGTYYGYVWRYKGDPFCKYDVNALKQKREVLQYSRSGVFIRQYDSIADAESETSTRHSEIIRVCKGERRTAGGYVWKYAEVI